MGLAQLLHLFVPALPVHTPLEYVALALGVSLVVGLLAGFSRRGGRRLDPVEALAADSATLSDRDCPARFSAAPQADVSHTDDR